MEKIHIEKVNSLYIKVNCDPGIAYELTDHFTFFAKDYRYHPLYRSKVWDGKIRLFNLRTRTIYAGLLHKVTKFADDNGYEWTCGEGLNTTEEFSVFEATEFIKTLNHPENIELRDYQIDSFVHCVRHGRSLFISPTASGKSLIIYWLVRYYASRTLIIVDSINLLNQMFSDFQEYGFDSEKYIDRIGGKHSETGKKPITIITWQSAATRPKEWFNQFNVVIGDEAHRYKAKSLKKIMESLPNCPYRFGFTGSLDGSESNQLTLEGLFGEFEQKKRTKDLIEEGYVSPVEIKVMRLIYDDTEKKAHTKDTYEQEISFLYSHRKRNVFVRNLALSLKGNTLLLFQRVDSHGVPLFDEIKQKSQDIPVYYVSGMVEGEEREEIRKIVNTHETSITVASVGTFSTGVNIPNIHNIIVASPTKSVVRVLQTIGRGIRKSSNKYKCTVFDIVDDLQWKRHSNYTLKHFAERVKIYAKEEFPYKIYNIDLGDKK